LKDEGNHQQGEENIENVGKDEVEKRDNGMWQVGRAKRGCKSETDWGG
jgi:hypothetical protein